MSKKNTGSSLLGCSLNLLISFIIVSGALTFAGIKGIPILGFANNIKSVILAKSSNDIANAANQTKGLLSSHETSTNDGGLKVSTPKISKAKETFDYSPLVFTGSKQFVNSELDSLGRATDGHIQLKYSDKPTSDREERITVDPVGWHNYRFKYEDEKGHIKKSYLMNRGHLIGYLFSGQNSEIKNLVPQTRYLNAGTMNDHKVDSSNPNSMLFYELQLNQWLKSHQNSTLDYYVRANYHGNDLVPHSISLYWTGFDSNGNNIAVNLNNFGNAKTKSKVSSVTLNNSSKNATINYSDGTAKPLY